MKRLRLHSVLTLVAIVANATVANAQIVFQKELKEKYDFKTVSCYTCHVRKSDIAEDQTAKFEENSKAFRNAIGKQLEELLKEKNVTQRLKDVKGLPREDPKREAVEEQVKKEFHEALEKLEAMKCPEGGTYKEALQKAKIDGIKLK